MRKPYPATLSFARTMLDLALHANDATAIQIQHEYLVHGDGSACSDGCDNRAIPTYLKLYNTVCREKGL